MSVRTPLRQGKVRRVATCKQATSLILDYLAGELEVKTARAFEKHLLECPDCVSFLNTYRQTVRALRSLRYEDIPADLKRRIQRFLRERIRKQSIHR